MKTGTLIFWNSRKNFGVVSSGKSNIYIKRHHITNPAPPVRVYGDMEVEFDTTVNPMEMKSTCDLTPRIKT